MTVDPMWENFAICELMTSIVQQNCQIIEPLTEKTCIDEVKLFLIYSDTKWRNISLVSRGGNR